MLAHCKKKKGKDSETMTRGEELLEKDNAPVNKITIRTRAAQAIEKITGTKISCVKNAFRKVPERRILHSERSAGNLPQQQRGMGRKVLFCSITFYNLEKRQS